MKGPPQKPGETSYPFWKIAEAVTDTTGSYSFSGLHKGDRYHFEIAGLGDLMIRNWTYQSPFSQTVETEDGATIEIPDAKFVSNGQSLSGVVVDPDGNPVSGISVSAQLASGGMLSRPQNGPPPWTETNAQGHFQLTSLPDEPIALMAYKANPAGGRIDYSANIRPAIGAQDIRIKFDPRLGSGIEDLDAK